MAASRDRPRALASAPIEGDALNVTFYGVRGSTPCHGPEVARIGGNTSCVAVEAPGHDPILLDLGTGARYFGLDHADDSAFHGHCLLSHFHWDHIQGLPFFPPLLRFGGVLDLHGPTPEDHDSIADVIDSMLCPPLFPVGVADLPGEVRVHDHLDDSFRIGEFEVTSRLIPHIGNTLGYRLDWKGRSIAYLSDHQQPGVGVFEAAPSAIELCDGADLVIHDAQYTEAEFVGKAAWGHCTIEYAIWVATEAGAKSVVLFHHDPLHDDDMLEAVARRCEQMRCGVDVIVAREGLTLRLDA